MLNPNAQPALNLDQMSEPSAAHLAHLIQGNFS